MQVGVLRKVRDETRNTDQYDNEERGGDGAMDAHARGVDEGGHDEEPAADAEESGQQPGEYAGDDESECAARGEPEPAARFKAARDARWRFLRIGIGRHFLADARPSGGAPHEHGDERHQQRERDEQRRIGKLGGEPGPDRGRGDAARGHQKAPTRDQQPSLHPADHADEGNGGDRE